MLKAVIEWFYLLISNISHSINRQIKNTEKCSWYNIIGNEMIWRNIQYVTYFTEDLLHFIYT